MLVVDLDRSKEVEDTTFFTGSVNKLTDEISISFTKNENGLLLTAVGTTGEIEDSYQFENADADSEALRDRNAMLIDSGRMVIGVPVRSGDMSRYYIFSYSADGGFMQLGVVDSPDGVPFERAVVDGDRIIMIGSGGMISVALDDLAGTFPQGREYEAFGPGLFHYVYIFEICIFTDQIDGIKAFDKLFRFLIAVFKRLKHISVNACRSGICDIDHPLFYENDHCRFGHDCGYGTENYGSDEQDRYIYYKDLHCETNLTDLHMKSLRLLECRI